LQEDLVVEDELELGLVVVVGAHDAESLFGRGRHALVEFGQQHLARRVVDSQTVDVVEEVLLLDVDGGHCDWHEQVVQPVYQLEDRPMVDLEDDFPQETVDDVLGSPLLAVLPAVASQVLRDEVRAVDENALSDDPQLPVEVLVDWVVADPGPLLAQDLVLEGVLPRGTDW
jgi:hypothetical protein